MNEDEHKRFLELLDKYQKAQREVENIRRENVSSGPGVAPPNPVTSADAADRRRRLEEAQARERRYEEQLRELSPTAFPDRT